MKRFKGNAKVARVTEIVEQSTGIKQVNEAIMQVGEVTQQSAALVEEPSATSDAMSEQAAAPSEQMKFFPMDKDTKRNDRCSSNQPWVGRDIATGSVRSAARQ